MPGETATLCGARDDASARGERELEGRRERGREKKCIYAAPPATRRRERTIPHDDGGDGDTATKPP